MNKKYIVREYITKNRRYWRIVDKNSRREFLGPFFEKEKAETRLRELEKDLGGVRDE